MTQTTNSLLPVLREPRRTPPRYGEAWLGTADRGIVIGPTDPRTIELWCTAATCAPGRFVAAIAIARPTGTATIYARGWWRRRSGALLFESSASGGCCCVRSVRADGWVVGEAWGLARTVDWRRIVIPFDVIDPFGFLVTPDEPGGNEAS